MTLNKFIVLAFFYLLTLLTTTYGQGKQDKSFTLVQIKNLCRQINNYKNYKTVIFDDAEEFLGHGTDNGGSLTGYFKNDTLKKIVEWIGLSNKVIQNEYYLDRGKLVFVYSTESRYRYNDSTQSFDYSKLDNIFKGRYYFRNDKLIDTILSNKQDIYTTQEDAENFLTSSRNYLKLFSAHRK